MNDQDAADASSHDSDAPTGTLGTGGPGGQSAAVPDWRELLAAHRFSAAKQAYFLSQRLQAAGAGTLPGTVPGATPLDTNARGRVLGADDEQVGPALSALADVEELVRERSYLKAKTRLERLESKPLLAPWQRLLDDLDVLAASSKALDRRDPDAAIEALAGLDDSWFEADALTQRGTALIYLGELEEAKDAFDRALAIDPQHYRALTNLGNVALEQGEVDEAILFYEQALKLNDQFANAHHNLGVAYRRKGQVGKSVRSLRRAQRVSQRVETVQARESFTRWSGQNSQKYVKWFLYAVAGAVLWWILSSQGII